MSQLRKSTVLRVHWNNVLILRWSLGLKRTPFDTPEKASRFGGSYLVLSLRIPTICFTLDLPLRLSLLP
jgi:hypothetical protein